MCKCKTKGKTYTAGDLKSESCVDKLINLDQGFRVLRNLHGSWTVQWRQNTEEHEKQLEAPSNLYGLYIQ